MQQSIWELFLTGGWVMWPLALCSIITWAIILERTWFLIQLRPQLNQLSDSLVQNLRSGDIDGAKQLCRTQKAQLSELFLTTLETRKNKETTERAAERNRIRFATYLKRNLWILGTIGSASPFLGLFGTVVGIIRAFFDMAEQGAGGFSVVAGGISEALIATAAGLIVAIVALIAYNIFTALANQTVTGIKLTLGEILDTVPTS